MWRLYLAVALTACAADLDYDKAEIVIEPISPPMPGGGATVITANGPVIVTESHITEDGGLSWGGIHPQVIASTAQAGRPDEAAVMTTAFGLGRWSMATDQVNAVNPPIQVAGFRHRPTGTLLVRSATGSTIARQPSGGAWTEVPLPAPPTMPSPAATVGDIVTNATVTLLSSAWGIYRSVDDGASWEFVFQPAAGTTKLLALDDGRFLLWRADTRVATVLDPMGLPTAITTPAFAQPPYEMVACLGAWINGAQFSRDLGQTWEPLVPQPPDRSLTVTSSACTGTSLVAHVRLGTAPTWLTQLDTLGVVGPLLPFAVTAATGFVRDADGTILADHLAWKPGDAAWSLRIMPDAEVHALADGTLYAPSPTEILRSRDAGRTWERTPITTPVPASDRYLVDSTGTMWASSADRLWRSDDGGVTWSMTTTIAPNNPSLVGIGADDTLVARSAGSGLHVSRDRGQTWTSSPFPGTYQLALVTHGGAAATLDRADPPDQHPVWHLWRDHGVGEAYRQVTVRVMADIADISQLGRQAQLDRDDHVYMLVPAGIYRSTRPLE